MRQVFFLVEAAVLAALTFELTTLAAANPFFCYGVSFIGYTVATCLALVATIGD